MLTVDAEQEVPLPPPPRRSRWNRQDIFDIIILANIRSQQKIVLAVASSGIAANLLDGGRTAHSTFKLPLDIHNKPNPMCNI